MSGVTSYQRELFATFEEFFHRATGRILKEVRAEGPFDQVIRSASHSLASRGEKAFTWVEEQLRRLYSNHKLEPFAAARSLTGIKTVLGGTSRFGEAQLASIQKMAVFQIIGEYLVPCGADRAANYHDESRKRCLAATD